ncbi:hypothetical protein WJX84_008111 [Apatococcus fuscideae]|uniref:Uncharacterized protein n=1 Tax=Apatococcus fuscideae TaxID=2026836 RepID=A0AAW1SLS4_9CHLO
MGETALQTRSPDSPVTPFQSQAARPRSLTPKRPASLEPHTSAQAEVPKSQQDQSEAEAGADILVGLRGGASLSSEDTPTSISQPSASLPELSSRDLDGEEALASFAQTQRKGPSFKVRS